MIVIRRDQWLGKRHHGQWRPVDLGQLDLVPRLFEIDVHWPREGRSTEGSGGDEVGFFPFAPLLGFGLDDDPIVPQPEYGSVYNVRTPYRVAS